MANAPKPVRRAKTIRRGRNVTRKDRSWERPFLAALAVVPNVTEAARKARVHRSTVYGRIREDEAFSKACDEAMAMGVDNLAGSYWRRCLVGDRKPMSVGGKLVYVREFPDTLGMFLLRAHDPGKYREQRELHHRMPMTLADAIVVAESTSDPDEGHDA